MSLFKKILISIILFLFLFILYFLLEKRNHILFNIEKTREKNILTEGYVESDVSIVKSIAFNPVEYPHGITGNMNEAFQQVPLNKMCFKAAANSAYTGSTITDLMVNYVLSRGCRFLDFEVYYLPDKNGSYNACVGYSEDPDAEIPSVSNSNHNTLYEMLKQTISNAFGNGSSEYKIMNSGDPLFINIRMKAKEDEIQNLFKSIQAVLKQLKKDPSYANYFTDEKIKNSSGYTLNTLMRKIVFVLEDRLYLKEDIYNGAFYNMLSNSTHRHNAMSKGFYSHIDIEKFEGCPPKIDTHGQVSFNCEHGFNYIAPDGNKTTQSNPNVYSSIFNYGNQITMMQYYKIDQELIENEKMFKTYNSSFVPMAYCLKYIDNYAVPDDLKGSDFFSTIPALF